MFAATSDDAGKLSVESLQNKYELANASANKITGLSFVSSDETGASADGTLKTTITNAAGTVGSGDSVSATGTSYVLDITSLADGDTVTIDGTTYTYDSAKSTTATTKPNTFNSAQDLIDLLGDDYDVSLEYSATQTTQAWDTTLQTPALGAAVIKDVTGTFGTKGTNISTLLTNTANAGIGHAQFSPTDAGLAAYNATAPTQASDPAKVTYSNAKLALVITKNSQPEEAIETTTKQDALNFSFQVGADTSIENKISVDIESMSAESLGVNGLRVDGKDSTNADAAVGVIAEAIQKVSTQRSALGAVQNRLEHTIANLDNVVENTTAAESQIRDTDMATEMVKFSNNNILAQAGQAMLAQANQANQGVLSLLG